MSINRNYVSETDKFISSVVKNTPNLKQKQKLLRNTWWDKEFIDEAEQETYAKSNSPLKGYAYYEDCTAKQK